MSKLILKEKPTLADFQKYVADMVEEMGFGKETATHIFMLFTEECGEMAKAIRKLENIHSDKNSEVFELGSEMADILIYLLDLANHFGIDLEKAFRDKEEKNKKRIWQ